IIPHPAVQGQLAAQERAAETPQIKVWAMRHGRQGQRAKGMSLSAEQTLQIAETEDSRKRRRQIGLAQRKLPVEVAAQIAQLMHCQEIPVALPIAIWHSRQRE